MNKLFLKRLAKNKVLLFLIALFIGVLVFLSIQKYCEIRTLNFFRDKSYIITPNLGTRKKQESFSYHKSKSVNSSQSQPDRCHSLIIESGSNKAFNFNYRKSICFRSKKKLNKRSFEAKVSNIKSTMENVSKAVEAPKNSKKYSEKLTRELDFKSIQVEKVKDKKLYSQTNMPRTQGLSKEKAMQKLLESNKIEQKKPIYAGQSSQSSEKGTNLEGNEEKNLIKKYGGFIEDGLIKYALDDFLNRYKSPEIHSSLRKENINAWKEKVSTYKKANIKCDIAKISKYEDETGKFQQYLYFLSRAQNEEQQIWWSEKLYNELQRDTGYRAFDINITLRLGDLIHSTFAEHSARDPELWKNAREKYNKILGNSQQLKTDFSKRWVLGGGKNWLNRNFKDSAGEPLYDSFVKKIRMTPEELMELKTTGLQKHKLKDKNGVPPSLKTLWLDLGLNPEVMIEFFTVLEAFRSKKVNKSSQNLGNLPDVQDLGRKFDSVALSQRYLELMKYFKNNPKEMEATISWFAENICPTRKFIESILKIGAQNGKSECTRWRYKVLLFSHWIARQVQKMFNVCAKLLRVKRIAV